MSKRYRLLFVDDEERVLRSLRSVFRRDYDIYVASSGVEALEILAQQPIDVIVSDQRMPNMTGNELLAKVRHQYPRVMRILLTGYVDKMAIIDTINEGEIFRYISKPWKIDDIKNTVALAAEASKSQLPLEREFGVKKTQQLEPQHNADKLTGAPQKTATIAQFPTQIDDSHRANRLSPEQRQRQKTSFVLMDKDQSVRNSIRTISRRFGFNVYVASSYIQAVKTFAIRQDVGVVILGIAADPKETLEAINLFKRHRPDLSVIALADHTDANVAIDLINQGQVFRYLQKPVDSKDFERAVLSAITRHQMLKEVKDLRQRYGVNAWMRPATAGIQKLKEFFKQSA